MTPHARFTNFKSALEPARAADDGHWPATADPADPVAVLISPPSLVASSDVSALAVALAPATAGAANWPDTGDDDGAVLISYSSSAFLMRALMPTSENVIQVSSSDISNHHQ